MASIGKFDIFKFTKITLLLLSLLINCNDCNDTVQKNSIPSNRQRVATTRPREIGYFWHLTDVFFDPFYSTLGTPENGCRVRNEGRNLSQNCGFFGEFGQCSAFGLVETIGRMMSRRSGNRSDFYLFTGNIRCPNQEQTPRTIYETMRAFVNDLKNAGLNSSIYPSYGWYDYHPYGHHPIKYTTFYEKMSETLRNQWEISAVLQSKWLMGYFSRVQLPKGRIRVVVLNTNYYMKKHIASQMADPSGQWSWLVRQLRGCRVTGQKAYIVMSIPPGIHEGSFRSSNDLLWAQKHNRRYIKIVRQYYDVIAAQFAGHHHLDTFRLVYSKSEQVISAILLAPSVEPRFSNLPSIRMYMYDMNTGELVDYVQYYFNLTLANMNADGSAPEKYWIVGYNFRDHYTLPDVSLKSLETLVARMEKSNLIFRRYIKATRSMQNGEMPCTDRCKMMIMCAITNLDQSSFFECLSGLDATIERRLVEIENAPETKRDRLLRPAERSKGASLSIALGTSGYRIYLFCTIVIRCWVLRE